MGVAADGVPNTWAGVPRAATRPSTSDFAAASIEGAHAEAASEANRTRASQCFERGMAEHPACTLARWQASEHRDDAPHPPHAFVQRQHVFRGLAEHVEAMTRV